MSLIANPSSTTLVPSASAPRARAKNRYLNFTFLSFLVMVLIPAIMATIYYGLIATDQYVAEARLALRPNSNNSVSPVTYDVKTPEGEELDPTGPSKKKDPNEFSAIAGNYSGMTGKEPFVLANYLRSENIVRELDSEVLLRKFYSRSNIDFLSRFDSRESPERLWKYWQSKVTATVDTISGVVTLQVAAFSREDALALANDVLRLGEKLINSYNDKSRADALNHAEADLKNAAERYKQAMASLRAARDAAGVTDPIAAAVATSELLLKAELELIKFKREQAVSGTFMSPDSPTITLMDQQIAALSQQVAQLQSQLASDRANAKAASGILAKFDELELARMFAERMFLIAQAAYEETRVSTERQEVFFVTFVRPTLPEKPMYPRRTVNTLLIFCGLFLTWSTLQLIIAGVKDHMI